MGFFGIRFTELPGDGFGQKAANFQNMPMKQVLNLASSYGFCAKVEAGEAIIIPGGMLVLTVSLDEEAMSLRWGFARPCDVQRVKNYMTMLMDAYDQLATTDYGTFLKYLNASE